MPASLLAAILDERWTKFPGESGGGVSMRGETILVIDDDVSALKVLQRRLQREGFSQVHITSSPEEGLELFNQLDPDLLILDLDMPVLDGFGVLAALREGNPEQLAETPVLVLTGQASKAAKLEALSLGARDFMIKPFDPVELAIRVQGNLEVRALLKRVTRHNSELDEEVRQRTADLQIANMEVIDRLMVAAEYRDDDTGSHIQRMSRYAYLVALEMGLDERASDDIMRASPMHDIGKIGIPDNILLKPGKLTASEWEIMKSHSQIGANLLANSRSALLNLAEEIALSHHEKWNGEGYPNGLKGEEIPLSGRIVAVCDVFDALTSERPYKSAWPEEKALAVLRAESGTHFDPRVVEAFFRVLPKILEIKNQFSESSSATLAV